MADKDRTKMGGRALLIALLVISFLAGAAFVLLIKGWNGPAPTGEPVPAPPVAEEARPLLPDEPRLRGAIIIDDMGARMSRLRSLAELDYKVTVSVLPHLRYSGRLAREANDMGFEVILHLPMEPGNTAIYRPGKGALYTSMEPDTMRERLAADILDVPGIKGVNNHMGSKFTEDSTGMGVVLEVLAKRGLFFIDSKTSPRSIAGKLAGRYGVKTASRDVFLDNEQDKDYIEGQFKEFIKAVKRRGSAIAIGHPYPETIEVLKETQEELREAGITVVNASELVE
ncbi:Putative periplasmic protein YibQ, distant homology with nucleoside diphosphatase and polysaccharide deacetylase [hydrothermal vent metagenome]|uniref:Periplasmic protein YibQ, distant homology with nucleoside diphosphatase and polysaccharide deacetylase n=1 Tax=hydrothermal vent metagenome TaxID=652676 RepID=A0A3B0QVZ8_9ZZZZ